MNNFLFTVVTEGTSMSFFSFASICFRFLAFSSSALRLASFFFSNTSWYLLDIMAYGCLSICLFPLHFGVSGYTRNSFIPSVWTTFITQETLLLTLLVDCTSAHEGGKAVSHKHRTPLPPRKYSWYSFLSEAELTPGP